MSANYNRNYNNVRIVLFERDNDVRQNLKQTLLQDTFTKTVATSGMKTVQSAIFSDQVDLMVVDIDADRKEFQAMMRKIRHHEIGDNPFPITIALSSDSHFRNVSQTMNAGFDIMLLKPFSMGTFLDRVHHLIRARSPFVVTADYIGPDRRLDQRPSARKDLLINVPNPLKIMASGEVTALRMQNDIKDGIDLVNEHRVVANGKKIVELVGELVSQYMLSDLDLEFIQVMKRLGVVCVEMDKRLRRSKFAHAAELCDTMGHVVTRMLKSPLAPSSKDIELIQNLGQAIDRAFHSDKAEIRAAHSITDSIRAPA
ncbi:MAG: response regulator transcription factor [Alphaproteobacteria bacterium]|nr:response regulator transcription factor [Alphaproteobacteria bacterium]